MFVSKSNGLKWLLSGFKLLSVVKQGRYLRFFSKKDSVKAQKEKQKRFECISSNKISVNTILQTANLKLFYAEAGGKQNGK